MLAATIATITAVVILGVIAIARIIDQPPHKRLFRAHRKSQGRVQSIITESSKDPRIVGEWVKP